MKHCRHIYLLHGKGGRPTGSAFLLEQRLRPLFPDSEFARPALLHGDPGALAEDSLEALKRIEIAEGATVIGISMGGLVAAALQESGRADLRVACVSSPTWIDGVVLRERMRSRLALYSSNDDVIAGRTAEWPQLAEAYDLQWLSHDTDQHLDRLSTILGSFLRGEDVAVVVKNVEATP